MNYLKPATAAAVALALAAGAVHAHKGARGIVKQRMDSMQDVRKSTKTLADMARGKRAFDRAAATRAATRIATEADRISALFPKGSLEAPSEASPAIWKDWSGFEKLASDMGAAAKALGERARTAIDSKAIAAATRDLTRTCAACHKRFRLSK